MLGNLFPRPDLREGFRRLLPSATDCARARVPLDHLVPSCQVHGSGAGGAQTRQATPIGG